MRIILRLEDIKGDEKFEVEHTFTSEHLELSALGSTDALYAEYLRLSRRLCERMHEHEEEKKTQET